MKASTQVRAAVAGNEPEGGGLEAELALSARNADLEDSRRPVGKRRVYDERRVATA